MKGVKKCAKKVAHGVKKGAENVASFVKDHKKEIMISAAVVAAVTGAYLISGALTTAAAADAPSGKKREDEEDPTTDLDSSSNAIPSAPSSVSIANDLFQGDKTPEDSNKSVSEQSIRPSIPAPTKNPEFDPNAYFGNPQTNFFENLRKDEIGQNPKISSELFYKNLSEKKDSGLSTTSNGFPSIDTLSPDANAFWQSAFSSYLNTLQNQSLEKNDRPFANPSFPTHDLKPEESNSVLAAITNLLVTVGHAANRSTILSASIGAVPTALARAFLAEPGPSKSCHVETEGIKYPKIQIGFINGMNTSFKECMSHLNYIKQFAGDMKIEGVYNHSNTVEVDGLEIFLLNYSGSAPVTSDLLIENWTRFHEENINDPDAKYLQFAHSMGTILTKDALQKAPKEIRDRIIVVALGPAVIIPDGLCYNSKHYASKNDHVHWGENIYTLVRAALVAPHKKIEFINEFVENKERLIILDPHPEAEGFDHGLQSPTFYKEIEELVKNYIKK